MTNVKLEEALRHAVQAQDIESLVGLARQEASSGERWYNLLHVVLTKCGPVRLGEEDVAKVALASGGSINMIRGHDGAWIVSASPMGQGLTGERESIRVK